VMCRANDVGAQLGQIDGVNALTDVTGFGLAGHLLEMCEGAHLAAIIDMSSIPELPALDYYIGQGCVPGGTERNRLATDNRLPELSLRDQTILFDPQTSGGLLIATTEDALPEVTRLLVQNDLSSAVIGEIVAAGIDSPRILLSQT